MTTDSVWLVGPALAIAEGQRVVTTADGKSSAATHFTLVLMRQEGQWKIASVREVDDDASLTPHDRLRPLAWMVGEWVDEGAEAAVKVSVRWSEDKNFLLADYEVVAEGKPGLKCSQRVGWDPAAMQVRSWVFDSDGGFGEGRWSQIDDRWMIKSTAVLPDGAQGSATIVLEPAGPDKFVMRGLDRLLGNEPQPDYTMTIVRRPPEPAN